MGNICLFNHILAKIVCYISLGQINSLLFFTYSYILLSTKIIYYVHFTGKSQLNFMLII